MIRGTTPPIVLTIKNVDLTQAESVYVTIKQIGRELTLTGESLTITAEAVDTQMVTTISFGLSQLESLGFNVGHASIQVNWMDDGKRGATKVACMNIDEQLLGRAIE